MAEIKKAATTKVAEKPVAKAAPAKAAATKPAVKVAEKPVAVKPAVATKTVAAPAKVAPAKAVEKPAVVKETVKPVAESKVVAKTPSVAKADKTQPVVKEKAKKGAKKPAPYVSNGELRVELVHSTASCTKRQIKTVHALGLKKINDVKIHKDNPAIQGMVKLVAHLVRVEQVK